MIVSDGLELGKKYILQYLIFFVFLASIFEFLNPDAQQLYQ
jgi:hypothetical protein